MFKIKSTTNTIALIVIVLSGLFMLYAMIFGSKDIPAEMYGFWGMIIGWVVGAKSSKAKYTKEAKAEEDYYPEI